MPNRMVMIYILYLPVAKLDAMVEKLEVRCEKECPFRVKRVSFWGKKTLFFDENLKLCNKKIKV